MASLPPIVEPPQEDPTKPAPGELEVLRRFVNTHEIDERTDSIATPEALRDWLAERGLLARTERLDEDDVRQARSVREAIRALLLANNGFELDPRAVETLNNAARTAEVVVSFGDGGTPQLSPVRPLARRERSAGRGRERPLERLRVALGQELALTHAGHESRQVTRVDHRGTRLERARRPLRQPHAAGYALEANLGATSVARIR